MPSLPHRSPLPTTYWISNGVDSVRSRRPIPQGFSLLVTILWLHSRERREGGNQKPLTYHVPKVRVRENLSTTSLGFAVVETCSVACYAQVYIAYCYCCQCSGKYDVFNRINNVKSSDTRRIFSLSIFRYLFPLDVRRSHYHPPSKSIVAPYWF